MNVVTRDAAERLAEIEEHIPLAFEYLSSLMRTGQAVLSAAMVRRVLTVGLEYGEASYVKSKHDLRVDIIEELADALFYAVLHQSYESRFKTEESEDE